MYYIGPMDTFTSGSESLSYRTDNPNPHKFAIDIDLKIEDEDDADYVERSVALQSDFVGTHPDTEGLQSRYIINYTTGSLSPITDSDEYTFSIADGASPDLVGQDYDSANVVMKYISEADLINYGAVLVEEELNEGDLPTPVGEREVEWILDDENYKDKFNRTVTQPLVDLKVTKLQELVGIFLLVSTSDRRQSR